MGLKGVMMSYDQFAQPLGLLPFPFLFFSMIFYCLLICYKDIWIKTYCQCYKQFLFNQQINRLRHNSYASFIIQESGVHRCEKINSFSNYHGNQNQRYLEQWQSWQSTHSCPQILVLSITSIHNCTSTSTNYIKGTQFGLKCQSPTQVNKTGIKCNALQASCHLRPSKVKKSLIYLEKQARVIGRQDQEYAPQGK